MKKLLISKKQALLILIDKIGPKVEYLAEYLANNIGQDKRVVLARFRDLVFEVNGKKIKVLVDTLDIKEFDLVYIRRADHKLFALAGTLALCLDSLGIPFIDTKFREIGAAGDKFTSLVKLSLAGLPTTPTIFCLHDRISSMADEIVSKFGFPVVAKDIVSQRGVGIFVLRSKNDFEKLSKKDGERTIQYLFQPYIQIDKECRLLVMGDKVVSAQKMKRDLTGFKARIDMEAEEKFVDVNQISEQMKSIAIQGAKLLGLQIAGADLFIEKGTSKVGLLEINRGPGFTYDPKISPELPKLAEYIKSRLDES